MFAIFFQIVVSIGLSLLTGLLTRKPSSSAPKVSVNDINISTVSEDRAVPVVFGRAKVFPNLIWYGDYEAQEVTKKVKSGLGSSQRVSLGYRYKIGMWFILCRESCDKVTRIYLNDKRGFDTPTLLDKLGNFTEIRARASFGPSSELQDGADAKIRIYSSKNPTLDPYIAKYLPIDSKLPDGGPVTPLDIPQYPNMTHAVWVGPSDGKPELPVTPLKTINPLRTVVSSRFPLFGGLFGNNGGNSGFIGTSGAVPNIAFLVERMPSFDTIFSDASGFPLPNEPAPYNYDTFRQIYLDTVRVNDFGDANPAWVLLEILRNHQWGCGYGAALIDYPSFAAAADVLYQEQNGVSLSLETSKPLKDYIEPILRQINGVIQETIDPTQPQQISLRLVRSTDQVKQVITESNIEQVLEFQKSSTADLVNEVILTYLDREQDYQARTVVAQNTALLSANNRKFSTEVNFEGLVDADTANRLAVRELRSLTSPITTATLVIRTQTILLPADVVLVNSPRLGLENVRMRVSSINYDEALFTAQVELVRDVFENGLEVFRTINQPVEPIRIGTPEPIVAAQNLVLPYELSRIEEQAVGFTAEYNMDLNTVSYLPLFYTSNPQDVTDSESQFRPSVVGYTTADLSYNDPATLLTVSSDIDSLSYLQFAYLPTEKAYLLIGNEIAEVQSLTIDGDALTYTATIKRAVFDSIPVNHPMGTKVTLVLDYYNQGDFFNTTIVNDSGASATYLQSIGLDTITHIPLSFNGFQYSDESLAVMFPFGINSVPRLRSAYPNPAAGTLINGVRGNIDAMGMLPDVSGDITVSWYTRNKLSLQAISFFEPSNIASEPNTDYFVNLYQDDGAGNFVLIESGFDAGNAVVLPSMNLVSGRRIKVELFTRKAFGMGSFIHSVPQIYYANFI